MGFTECKTITLYSSMNGKVPFKKKHFVLLSLIKITKSYTKITSGQTRVQSMVMKVMVMKEW